MDNEPDCIAIGEVNHQALFKRVAASRSPRRRRTTHAATHGRQRPRLSSPQHYDQYYWAGRVEQLGIGIAHTTSAPTTDSLTKALEQTLQSDVIAGPKPSPPQSASDGNTGRRLALAKRSLTPACSGQGRRFANLRRVSG